MPGTGDHTPTGTPSAQDPTAWSPRDHGLSYLCGQPFAASRTPGVVPVPAVSCPAPHSPGLAVLAIELAGEDKVASVAAVAVLVGGGHQGQDIHIMEAVPLTGSGHSRRGGTAQAVPTCAVALRAVGGRSARPSQPPAPTQRSAEGQCARTCRARDTHQSETHFILATGSAQPLQADPAVQVEGGLWERVSCREDVPVLAEVELVERLDVLLGKLIEDLQVVAD